MKDIKKTSSSWLYFIWSVLLLIIPITMILSETNFNEKLFLLTTPYFLFPFLTTLGYFLIAINLLPKTKYTDKSLKINFPLTIVTLILLFLFTGEGEGDMLSAILTPIAGFITFTLSFSFLAISDMKNNNSKFLVISAAVIIISTIYLLYEIYR